MAHTGFTMTNTTTIDMGEVMAILTAVGVDAVINYANGRGSLTATHTDESTGEVSAFVEVGPWNDSGDDLPVAVEGVTITTSVSGRRLPVKDKSAMGLSVTVRGMLAIAVAFGGAS